MDEIEEFIRAEWLDDAQPGSHGTIEVIPTMERYIWSIPVFWGHREVDKHGWITLSWLMPPECEHCHKL